MRMLGRKTLKSERARMRRIDLAFERAGQAILIGFFLFTIASWLSYRDAFRITSVFVEGAHATNAAEVATVSERHLAERYLWKIDRNNPLLYPRHALAQAIFALDAHIEDVDLAVTDDNRLRVHITEYTPDLLWCERSDDSGTSTERCFLADKNGYVFAPAPDYSGYPFTVYRTAIAGSEESGSPVGLSLLAGDEFAKLARTNEILARRGIVVREVTHIEGHDYDLRSDKPWTIRLTTDKDASSTVENLFVVLDGIAMEKKGTTTPSLIDLRFGNKVFYR